MTDEKKHQFAEQFVKLIKSCNDDSELLDIGITMINKIEDQVNKPTKLAQIVLELAEERFHESPHLMSAWESYKDGFIAGYEIDKTISEARYIKQSQVQ